MTPLPLKKLRPPTRRTVSDCHVSQMMDDLEKNGQLRPIIIDSRFNIKDGFARFLAAKRLGWEKIGTDKITNGPVIAKSASRCGRRLDSTQLGTTYHEQF